MLCLLDYSRKRFQRKKMAITIEHDRIVLPDVLKPAYLRGKALFIDAIFSALEKRHFIDPQTQIGFWQQLTEKNNFIQTTIEHADLLTHVTITGEASGKTHQAIAETLYYLLLWDANAQGNSDLVKTMTEGFVAHFLPGTFPRESGKQTMEEYRKEIMTELAKQWHTRPVVKESFDIAEKTVEFKLVAKVPQHRDTVLIDLSGARLKPTRLEAYQRVLGALRMGKLRFNFPKKYG